MNLTSRQRRLINEINLDPGLRRAANMARTAPTDRELGWVGGKKFRGNKDSVNIEYTPGDDKVVGQFAYHTHPVPQGQDNVIFSFPSVQDLESAAQMSVHGIRGITIFAGSYYTAIAPVDISKTRNYNRYVSAMKRGDIEDAIAAIKWCGFDIETGQH